MHKKLARASFPRSCSMATDFVAAHDQALAACAEALGKRPEQFALVTVDAEGTAWATSFGDLPTLGGAMMATLREIMLGTGEDVEHPD